MLFLEKQRKKHERKYGPPLPKPRSEHAELPWDYNSELYAFAKRLGEDFNEETLRAAFTHPNFVTNEIEKRKELELDGELDMPDNEELSEIGVDFTSEYIKSYLRLVYPNYPDDGISAAKDHLTSIEVSSHIASNLGVSDLIKYPIFPFPQDVVQKTFFAVVGALLQDQGPDRTGLFVRDFFLPQFIGKDINDSWELVNPMGLLVEILQQQGKALPEPRLIRQTGSSTLVAMYMVGIYCDQELIGFAPGSSVLEAEDQATRVALKNIFGTNPEKSPPLPIDGPAGKYLHANTIKLLMEQNRVPQMMSINQRERTALQD
ncbi:large ribosomal subunit protein mL44-like [Glandiceps talaboti]